MTEFPNIAIPKTPTEDNTKKILITVGVVLVIIVGLAVYFTWPSPEEEISRETPTTATAPLGEFEIENPKMTVPLKEEEIPEAVIKLKISSTGFEPKEFTVKSGQPVSLTLTGLDKGTHILKFDSSRLANVIIAVAGNTRGISFIVPEKGDYTFYCSIPGHREAGEVGVMHVE